MAIPVKEKSKITKIGTFNDETEFTMKSSAHAFNILSSAVYTDPITAVIREYSCNALDAQTEAGVDKPFVVHLPTILEPYFSVRDFGTGLSHEDCMGVFTTYFESTKTATNTQEGMLGLGSKSAYSISDSFKVVSYYNGEMRTYSAYKDDVDCPKFALLSTEKTTESNGLLIEVPTKASDNHNFEAKARDVFANFSKMPEINSVKVKEYVKKYKDAITLDHKDFRTIENPNGKYHEKKLSVLMGNIVYGVDDKSFITDDLAYLKEMDLIIKMDLGQCSFNPGREKVRLNPFTIRNLIAKLHIVDQELINEIEKEVQVAKNFYEAYKLASKYSYISKRIDKIKWRGKPLKRKKLTGKALAYSDDYGSKMDCEFGDYSPRVEYYWNKQGYVNRIKAHLKGSYYNNDKPIKIILIEKVHVKEIGFDDSYVKDLDSLPQVTTSNTTATSTRTYDNHRVFVWNGGNDSGPSYNGSGGAKSNWNKETIDLADGIERIYVELSYYEPLRMTASGIYNCRDLAKLKKMLPDTIFPKEIIGIKSSLAKTQKFKKYNHTRLDEYLKREWNKLPKKERVVEIRRNTTYDKVISSLSAKVECKLFKSLPNILPSNNDLDVRLLKTLGMKVEESKKIDTTIDKIMDKYPLLEYFPRYNNEAEARNHFVEMVNIYSKRRTNKITNNTKGVSQ